MANITVQAIAAYLNDLVCDKRDLTIVTRAITELKENELPYLANGWTAQTLLQNLTAGSGTVALTEPESKVLALFAYGRELSHEEHSTLQAHDMTWRVHVGAPRAWLTEHEEDRSLRLYPIPTVTTTGTSDTIATEFDRCVVLSMGPHFDLPKYLRLPAALWVLSREYSRESAHRDMEFAKVAQALAERFFNLVDGIVVDPATAK